jgi:DNA-binding NarL/FixJ family response regulator
MNSEPDSRACRPPRRQKQALASIRSPRCRLERSTAPDDFAAAIRQSFENSIYLANRRGEGLAERGVGKSGEPAKVKLTRREREILRLLADGYSNAQLAQMLWVTEQTVKFHLSNIYRKLNVSNRTEASRWAHIHGFLTPSAERTHGDLVPA